MRWKAPLTMACAIASAALADEPPGVPPQAKAAPAPDAARLARDKLGFLVRAWTVEGKEDTFTETCDWFHDRSHVVCNSETVTPEKISKGVSVFSWSAQTGRYLYYHYGSSGVAVEMDVFLVDGGLMATYEREVGRDLVREHVWMMPRPDGSFDFREDDSVNGGPWKTVAQFHYIEKRAGSK